MFDSYFVYLCSCTVLRIVSTFVYSCLFPIFVQVYRPLPQGGNPIAVNKYHIISYHIQNWDTMHQGHQCRLKSGDQLRWYS